ncbi:hypothetical protein KV395_17490 [Microbacterium luteolum]|uniref:Uncharacterized protein n=1 Tax=Microbacterium luteolum TaxID=69367 RepID=A0ABY7XWG5_MICLT|nr:hypothetical protein [Microbacterium luteolum]WDM44933.1 hypothetical protein KV395_17490 [Microbacterium luteolum]
MSLRTNLQSPATRWPTIAVLIASGVSMLLVIATLLSVPAMLVGAAVPFVAWMPYLYGVAIGATVLSTLVLQRRSSRNV